MAGLRVCDDEEVLLVIRPEVKQGLVGADVPLWGGCSDSRLERSACFVDIDEECFDRSAGVAPVFGSDLSRVPIVFAREVGPEAAPNHERWILRGAEVLSTLAVRPFRDLHRRGPAVLDAYAVKLSTVSLCEGKDFEIAFHCTSPKQATVVATANTIPFLLEIAIFPIV